MADDEFEDLSGEIEQLIGRFAMHMAYVEAALIQVAAELAKPRLTAHEVRALPGNWRVDDAILKVRALIRTEPITEDECADLSDALDHVKACNRYRNKLVHCMIAELPDPLLERVADDFQFEADVPFVATNVHAARTDDAIFAIPVSADLIRAAMLDVRKGVAHFLGFRIRVVAPELDRRKRSGWQFKFPQPQGNLERAMRDEVMRPGDQE